MPTFSGRPSAVNTNSPRWSSWILSASQKEQLVAEYLAGEETADLAARYGVQAQSILKILHRRGVMLRPNPVYVLNDQEKEAVLAAYAAGARPCDLAKNWGVSSSAIQGVLKRRGLRRAPTHPSVYPVDHDAFREIKTEAQSYWLGFITADGCVHRRQLKVGLQRRDAGHLLKLRDFLGTDAPVKHTLALNKQTGRRHPFSAIAVTSVALLADLARTGITPRKSLVVKPWREAHGSLGRHYWRGLVDGDGSLFLSGDGRWHVSLVGTLAIVEGFASYVQELTGRSVALRQDANIWEVRYTAHPVVQALAQNLYGDTTVFLDRKKRLADRMLETHKRHWTSRAYLSSDDLQALRAKHGSWRALAAEWGVSESTVLSLARRKGIQRETRDFSWLTAEEYDKLLAIHKTNKAVARHLGLLPETLYKIRKRIGRLG